MKYTKDIRISNMFEKCGMMLKSNDDFYDNHTLPEKNDLMFITEPEYENADAASKLETINKFLFEKNHFRIIDWKFFFANSEIGYNNEKEMLGKVIGSLRIYYENNVLRFSNHFEADNYINELAKNKEFMKIFSKEFQVKATFLSVDQMMLKKEIITLIGDKIKSLDFFKKIEVELPNLILKDLK
jgi:hypothetical protein